jgi:hypothetical protein
MEYDALISSISKITLSKEEEKKEYIPQFAELYGNPESEQIIAEDPYYLNKMKETVEQLKSIRRQYSSNKDFYFAVSKMFAQTYIPLMIQEYGITNEELVSKLLNIANGNGIKIFDRGEAQSYAESFGDRINGDVGAFKYRDMVCFTPDAESKQAEVSTEESVMNATRMLSSMIHETMHLVIDVTKEEHFSYGDESKLTSEEKEIIIARQFYIDLIISDHSVSFILDRLNCYGIDSLLNNEDKLKTASIMFNVRSDVLRTKLFLMKKRQEKEKQMKLSKKESL